MLPHCGKNLSCPGWIPGGAAGFLGLAICFSSLLASCGEPRRPDVLLVVVDTLRADRMSCYGYERPTTPFLDQLANEGALFEDVTAQFSWTVPSMVSMFTGHYLTDLAEQVGPGERTITQSFKRAGYATFGASANLLLQEDTGLLAGFESFDAMPEEGGADRSLLELGRSVLSALDKRFPSISSDSDRAPVFMYLHAFEPHDPYRRFANAPEELSTTGAPIVQPENWHRDRLSDYADLAPPKSSMWASELDWINRARGRYDHEIRSVDEQLMNFFELLRERGLLDNAIVALVSDHGEGLWEHEPPNWLRERALETPEFLERLPRELFYQKHGAIQYQEVLATPMLIWGSGIAAGTRVENAVENIDLLPTLLELAGLPLQADYHGTSLAPLLRGERVRPRSFVYSLGVQGASVREVSSSFKLIVPQRKSAIEGEPLQLFQLSKDPHERENLAVSRPADVQRLLAALEKWTEKHPVNRDPRSGSRAAERTAALRKRLSAIGYTDAEATASED